MKMWVIKNWILVSSGLLLTARFVNIAYEERGYVAYGGEWLTLPIMIMIKLLIHDFAKEIRQWI